MIIVSSDCCILKHDEKNAGGALSHLVICDDILSLSIICVQSGRLCIMFLFFYRMRRPFVLDFYQLKFLFFFIVQHPNHDPSDLRLLYS
jgi:hypothetical protein